MQNPKRNSSLMLSMYFQQTPDQQAYQDEEQLRLLSLFHYIGGGIIALCSSFALIHFFVGLGMMTNPQAFGSPKNPAPPGIGLMFMLIGGGFVLGGWTVGALVAYAGKCIKQRKHYIFVLVMAGVECIHMPIGTALGVFTFIVMTRPSVKAIFAQPMPPPPGPPYPGQP